MKDSHLLFLLVGLWLSLTPLAAQDIEVRAYLDNAHVGLGEQFTLSVEMSGSQASSADPEPPDLGDFATPLGSGNSSQIQVVNGRMTVTRTINYYFQAAQEGEFRIPPVKVNTPAGRLTTEALSIRVDRTSPAPTRSRNRTSPQQLEGDDLGSDQLFVDVSASKKTVYQGEAVVVTYDILTQVSVSTYSLVDLPSTQGFWVEDYPISQPETRNEIVNGRRYTVATIKQMALIPTASGSKTIAPLVVECDVRVRRRGDLFDDFFSGPFGRSQKRRVASPPLEIEVLPLPAEGRPAAFTGGVGFFSLQADVDKKRVEANQALTVRLTIHGEGNITSINAPEINFPASFETYPPESETKTSRLPSGIEGEKVLEYVVVPRQAGTFEIPPVEFAFFDPDSETYKSIRTDPIELEVAPSADVALSSDPSISKREVELLNEDIRFLKSDTTLRRQAEGLIDIWILLVGLAGPLLLLAGALLFQRHREKLASDLGYARLRRSQKLARARLTAARRLLDSGGQDDFYAEIERALVGFVSDRMNLPEAGLLTSQLRKNLIDSDIPEEVVARYVDCLKTCQQKRFAPVGDSRKERKASLQTAESVIAKLARRLEAVKGKSK